MDFLTAAGGAPGDSDTDIQSFAAGGEFILNGAQLLICRIGGIGDDKAQIKIIIIKIEKGGDVFFKSIVNTLAGDNYQRAGPVAVTLLGGFFDGVQIVLICLQQKIQLPPKVR